MFKRFLGAVALCCAPLLAGPALADGFTSSIRDSVEISVQGAAVQTSRMGSQYAVSGVNVTPAGSFGLGAGAGAVAPTAGSSGSPAIPTLTSFSVTNSGQEFNLSEKLIVGDSVINPTVVTSGQVAPVTYSNTTTQVAGNASTYSSGVQSTAAATIDTINQTMSVTAGGLGTTVGASRTVSLSAF